DLGTNAKPRCEGRCLAERGCVRRTSRSASELDLFPSDAQHDENALRLAFQAQSRSAAKHAPMRTSRPTVARACFVGFTRHHARMSAPSQTPPPVKRGCFFYGCITLLVVGVLAGLIGYFGYLYVIKASDRLISEYTDTVPATLEKVEVSPERLQEVQQR